MTQRRPTTSRARELLLRALTWVTLFLALSLSVLAPGDARADDAAHAPSDAPTSPRIAVGPLPPLPVTYQVEKLGWWTLSYPASARERVRPMVEHADEWKAQLASDFGQDVLARPLEVRVARTWDDMAALVPHGLGVPAYASGVTYGGPTRLVVLTLTAPTGGEATDLETVFRHELSHVALEDAVDDGTDRAGPGVPRWFNEGLAIHESGELALTRMRTLWDATLFRQLLPFSELDRAFAEGPAREELAYAESADVVRFLLRGKERQRFVSFIERLRAGTPFDRALGDAYGTDMRKLEYEWREDTAKRNTFAPMLASGSFIWVLGFGALVLGYRRRRKQAAATLARWEREELALASAAALAARPVTAREDEVPFADPASSPVGLPKVEHDGDWHTLH